LIHSNRAAGAVLSGTKRPPNPTLLRTDLNRPVLNFETETEAVNHVPARQADDRNHRLWEAAGTAHVDNDALKLFGYLEHSHRFGGVMLGAAMSWFKPSAGLHRWRSARGRPAGGHGLAVVGFEDGRRALLH